MGKKASKKADPKNGKRALNITHGRIFRRYWGSILGTLALIILSAGLWLVQPFLLGIAIDGLTKGIWTGVLWLAALQAATLVIGAARRIYDVRVYTRIYRDIGEEALVASNAAGVELTRITARANMLREVVTFFEFRVPATLRSFIDLVGSLAFLAFLSMPVFFACVGGAAAIALTAFLFSGRLLRVNAALNDQLEKEVDIYSRRTAEDARHHLRTLAGHQVRRSDLQVGMFVINSVALMGVLFFSLYQIVGVEGAAIGMVFSVFTYVIRFLGAVDALPTAYVELLRTIEITRRINDIVIVAPDEGETAPGESERVARAMQYLAGESRRTARARLYDPGAWGP